MATRPSDGEVSIAKKQKINLNEDICKILYELGEIERQKGDRIRWKAYRTAVDVISASDKRISNGKEAMQLKGVGKKIGQKIDEIIATGQLGKLNALKDDPKVVAVAELSKIHGIGPVFARKLVDEHGCTGVDDLVTKGIKLNHQQQLGVKYYRDSLQPIPRTEVAQLEDRVRKVLLMVDPCILLTICGSYRRGKATSHDIDCLITHPETSSDASATYTYLKVAVNRLQQADVIVDILSQGPTKFMGYCHKAAGAMVRRIDMRFVPFDCYWPAVLYFTGSDLFNVQMRIHSLSKGYTINEYGVYPCDENGEKIGDKICVSSEEEIFSLIGLSYTPPAERSL